MSLLVRAAWAFFLVVVFPSLGAAQKLVVGNTAISAEGLPIWFAHETGIYKKNGLDVQPVFLGGGGPRSLSVILSASARSPMARVCL
jgi:ABC-type nitrate/sulfonate/bicarbonate transport system substrate-binding protein